MSVFKPLTVARIDEGRVLSALEVEFNRAQRQLCAYAEKFGDKAKKAKATIELRLEVEVVNPDDGHFDVFAHVKSKQPARPVKVTSAFGSTDDQGALALFARASGSTDGNPRQHVFATEDGELVDPKTGEVTRA